MEENLEIFKEMISSEKSVTMLHDLKAFLSRRELVVSTASLHLGFERAKYSKKRRCAFQQQSHTIFHQVFSEWHENH